MHRPVLVLTLGAHLVPELGLLMPVLSTHSLGDSEEETRGGKTDADAGPQAAGEERSPQHRQDRREQSLIHKD